MKVETFEAISLEEQDGQVINELVSEEALALIETLNLGGQRRLLAEREVDGETVTVRNPYRLMTAPEAAVFRAIMPKRTKIAEYEDGPIPLRALQVAAHAVTCGLEHIEVWHPEPGRDDPVLVGMTHQHASERFLLARWGEVLEPMEVLTEKARTILTAQVRARVAKAKGIVNRFEDGLAEKVEAFLLTGKGDTEFVSLSFDRDF